MFDNNTVLLSWEKSRSNLFRLQRRILKSVFIGDLVYALKLQKLLIISNSARLLSIRFNTTFTKDLLVADKISKISLNEKFRINALLLKSAYSWKPVNCKDIVFTNDYINTCSSFKLWSIQDRCWQCLVKFALEPAHIVNFYPRNFNIEMVANIQKCISLSLIKESYGYQKRVLVVKFNDKFNSINNLYLLNKIFAPRSIKISIFKFLKANLEISYLSERLNPLGFFLAKVLFNDLHFSLDCISIGPNVLILLKPLDDERLVINKIFKFLNIVSVDEVRN